MAHPDTLGGDAADAGVKPLLRGVSHLVAWFLTLVACWFLFRTPAPALLHRAAVVYGCSLSLMFGLSALYHRPMWSAGSRSVLRKLDHAGIFLMIAGTFTPLAVLDRGERSAPLLWVMWLGAAAGVAFAVLWSYAPRMLRTGVYIALGAVAAPVMLHLHHVVGVAPVVSLLMGALIYLVGAVVYAKRWPNPRPAIFGYHEVFHLMVILAASLQFRVVMAQLVAR